jgi:hypothetical protein
LLGLFLAGCSYDEGPLPGDAEPLAQEESALKAAKKKHEVPFKSNFVLHSMNFYPDAEEADKYHQELEGTGNATHMGKTKVLIPDELMYTEDFVDWTATADVILTGANGDQLFFSYESSFTYDGGTHVIGEGPITGGTGKFEYASGWMVYDGLWVEGEPGDVKFYGTIKY